MTLFKKRNYKVVKSFGLSPETVEKLEKIKELSGVSKSQIVDEIISLFGDDLNNEDFTSIEIDIKPMVKKRPRFGNGIAFKDEKTRLYESQLKREFVNSWKSEQLACPLEVDICFKFEYPKTTIHGYPSKTDVDNLAKACLDAANGVVWKDDRQIVKMTCSKEFCEQNKIIFKVRECDIDLSRWVKRKNGYKLSQ